METPTKLSKHIEDIASDLTQADDWDISVHCSGETIYLSVRAGLNYTDDHEAYMNKLFSIHSAIEKHTMKTHIESSDDGAQLYGSQLKNVKVVNKTKSTQTLPYVNTVYDNHLTKWQLCVNAVAIIAFLLSIRNTMLTMV